MKVKVTRLYDYLDEEVSNLVALMENEIGLLVDKVVLFYSDVDDLEEEEIMHVFVNKRNEEI